jgi:hypothetical protein
MRSGRANITKGGMNKPKGGTDASVFRAALDRLVTVINRLGSRVEVKVKNRAVEPGAPGLAFETWESTNLSGPIGIS